ncbi:MAG: DUF2442 domain-containing protein [Rhizobiaceae bacterium]|nr:DUF2442 domain-containing protein [Rhizobiaceae bacterium]
MTSSNFETDDARPVEVRFDADFVFVALADGRQVRAPLWWYPFLLRASSEERAKFELEFAGIWWPGLDDGLSVKGVMLGWKAPGAVEPSLAAE